VPSTGSVIYSYVWDLWDGSSTATTAPFLTEVINIGGQPGTDELHYTCRPVALDGQNTTLSGTFTVNNRPTILPGVSISANDGYFAFATQLQLRALDVDGNAFGFAWYTGTTFLGLGTASFAGSLSGTWTGNGTTIINNFAGTQNFIDLVIASNRVVTCYVVDVRGGTAAVDFTMRGEANPPPAISVIAGVNDIGFDAASAPITRIGVGQEVDFTVFVAPLPTHTVGFSWSFAGSNNWTMAPAAEAGTTFLLPNGGYQNTVHRDISTEVVSTGTSKVVTAEVRVTAVNNLNAQVTHTDAQYEVTLIKNSAPSAVTVARSVNGSPVTGTGPIAAADPLEFTATGTDADMDVLFYEWRFTPPFAPNPLYLWGPKVVYDTTGYTSGQLVQGQLAVIDRLGATLTVVLPSTSIT